MDVVLPKELDAFIRLAKKFSTKGPRLTSETYLLVQSSDLRRREQMYIDGLQPSARTLSVVAATVEPQQPQVSSPAKTWTFFR